MDVDETQSRSVLSSILPIFAPDMFAEIGWGWGGTLLAGIALVAVPAPMIVRFLCFVLGETSAEVCKMFRYGRQLREKYAFEG